MKPDSLKLAQKIANEVWQPYDDTHGYRTEKQERNAAVNIDDPENIWFFWNQFDSSNQNKFQQLVIDATLNRAPGALDLLIWVNTQVSDRDALLATLPQQLKEML